jgi:hypothetical protein
MGVSVRHFHAIRLLYQYNAFLEHTKMSSACKNKLMRYPVLHFWPALEGVSPYVCRPSRRFVPHVSQTLTTAQTALVLVRRLQRLRANVSVDRLLSPEVGTCGIAI